MPYHTTDLMRRAYRGELAHRHVVALSGYHRIQASPGYRAAAQYVAAQVQAAGVEAVIHSYPADGRARFWTTPSFLEWTCSTATLHLLDEQGVAGELLCDFEAVPISLVQRSVSVDGDFDIVIPGGKGGVEAEDYAGLDVRGKVVLTDQRPSRVAAVAVSQLGAAGILFDGMKAGGRSELDLPDARQYTSFWWGGSVAPDAWGFVLSPRQGRSLRAKLADGKAMRIRAHIDSRFYAGSFEVVDAFIPGSDPAAGEVLLVSHLCHPRPGAHDNGSGAAALIEVAAMLARLISDGQLARPRRGIRLLWPPEMTGTFAWLAEHEGEVRSGRWLAGLNLDMVGADQCQTGSIWELVSLPQASASFADHLLSWLREPFLDGQRHRETPFSAGSDHYILSDPTVGIPTPMMIQWPDTYYHTSADTPDKVSPDSLARSGALAAVYAYWLAAAGAAEAAWLGHLMVSRYATQASRLAAAAVEAVRGAADASSASRAWIRYRRDNAFRSRRMVAALDTLLRLDAAVAAGLPGLRDRVLVITSDEAAWAQAQLAASLPADPPPDNAEWRAEAAHLTPRRLRPGPIDVSMALQADHPDLLLKFQALSARAGDTLHDQEPIWQYWADGRHSVAEIADFTAMEIGSEPNDLVLAYFKLLAGAGLVTAE